VLFDFFHPNDKTEPLLSMTPSPATNQGYQAHSGGQASVDGRKERRQLGTAELIDYVVAQNPRFARPNRLAAYTKLEDELKV
jgi:hypothetical protein